MKKTIKTEDALKAYNIISQAKYSKMDDADKVRAWKIARALKPVATRFDEDSRDAADKLKPTDDFTERLGKAQEYERLTKEGQPTIDIMTTADYHAFVKEFQKYNQLVADAVKEFGAKEVELDFEPLTDDAFGKLMASNEWTMEQATALGELAVAPAEGE